MNAAQAISHILQGEVEDRFNEKLEALRATLEAQQRARLLAGGMTRELLDAHDNHYTASVKTGRKYANVDFGGSGKYMVELATGAIYGIKAYGVIHRGHYYGTLDTISNYDWSDYHARQIKRAA